jgi:hypothetical protein
VTALGRKNFLFAGSDTGSDRAAAIYTMVQTAKLNGVNPETYLKDSLLPSLTAVDLKDVGVSDRRRLLDAIAACWCVGASQARVPTDVSLIGSNHFSRSYMLQYMQS